MKHLGYTLQLFALILVLALFTSPALAAEPQQVTGIGEPVVSLSLSVTDILILVVGVGYLIVQILKSKPGQADQTLVAELRREEERRANIERLERAYQETTRQIRAVVDTFASGLRFISPYTPIKSDDAVARWLDDIRVPGAPLDSPPSLAYDPYKTATSEPEPTATKSIFPPPDSTTPQG